MELKGKEEGSFLVRSGKDLSYYVLSHIRSNIIHHAKISKTELPLSVLFQKYYENRAKQSVSEESSTLAIDEDEKDEARGKRLVRTESLRSEFFGDHVAIGLMEYCFFKRYR